MMQAYGLGLFKSLEEGRDCIRNSFTFEEYDPEDASTWSQYYEKNKELLVRNR